MSNTETENEKRKLKKKSSLIYVLKILEKYSHQDNPLTHEAIAGYLLEDYDIELERKAISKCIDTLESADYDIVRLPGKGTYLGAPSELEDAQVQLMLDSVLSNRTLSAREARKLMEFLLKQGSAGLREKNWNIFSLNTWGKSENTSVRYSIDKIQQAMSHRRQIRFLYDDYTYGLHHTIYGLHRNAGKDAPVIASPVRVLPKNGYEYLVAIIQWEPQGKREYRLECFRLDLMRSVDETEETAVPVEQVPGYENGFDPQKFLTAYPTMTTGRKPPEMVKFAFLALDKDLVTQALGQNVWISQAGIGTAKGDYAWMCATVSMGLQEAIDLAMRYPEALKLIYPPAARKALQRKLNKALESCRWADTYFPDK